MGGVRRALISFLLIVTGGVCLQHDGDVGVIGATLMGVGVGLILTLKKQEIMGSEIITVRVVTAQKFTDLDKAELVLNMKRILEDQLDVLVPDGMEIEGVIIYNSEHEETIKPN